MNMAFFHLSSRWRGRSAGSTTSHRPMARRLTLEALEDRSLPSTVAAGALVDPIASTAAAVVSSSSTTQAQSFHVDGTFQVLYTHGSDLGATSEGTLVLGGQTRLHYKITTEVKQSGNNIQGTPTMVFDDGSTLTFTYAIKLNQASNVFSGTWSVTGGTGMFAGATGVGTISYPIAASLTGPLTMDGTILL
jgi:hypothetical protein